MNFSWNVIIRLAILLRRVLLLKSPLLDFLGIIRENVLQFVKSVAENRNQVLLFLVVLALQKWPHFAAWCYVCSCFLKVVFNFNLASFVDQSGNCIEIVTLCCIVKTWWSIRVHRFVISSCFYQEIDNLAVASRGSNHERCHVVLCSLFNIRSINYQEVDYFEISNPAGKMEHTPAIFSLIA